MKNVSYLPCISGFVLKPKADRTLWDLRVWHTVGLKKDPKKNLILLPSSCSLFAGPTSSKAITLTATRQWPEVSKEQRQTASAAGEQLLANLLSPSIIHGALEKISSVPPVCLIWQCNSGLVTEILNLSGLPFSKATHTHTHTQDTSFCTKLSAVCLSTASILSGFLRQMFSPHVLLWYSNIHRRQSEKCTCSKRMNNNVTCHMYTVAWNQVHPCCCAWFYYAFQDCP